MASRNPHSARWRSWRRHTGPYARCWLLAHVNNNSSPNFLLMAGIFDYTPQQADVSDGIMLMSNEALHKLCNKLYNIPRPSFADMNTIAARYVHAWVVWGAVLEAGCCGRCC